MKLAWINLLPRETEPHIGKDLSPVWEGFEKYFKKVTSRRKDVQVELCFPERSTWTVHYPYIEFLNNRWFVERAFGAVKEGADAVVVGAATDTGLQYLREALKVPVVGISESAFLLACTLGSRFAGITVFRRLIPPKERNIRAYGLEARAIAREPIRSCELTFDDVAGLFDEKVVKGSIIPKFEAVAKACIEDGAEVVICDDAWLAPSLVLFDYTKVPGTEVPVLDAAGVAIKFAEILCDLRALEGLETSRALTYSCATEEELERARKIYLS